MKIKYRTYTLSFVFLVAISCGTSQQDAYHAFDKNFRIYYSQAFKKKFDKNFNYYVLDMEGCSDCVEEHFEYLDSLKIKENVRFIMAGRVTKNDWLVKLNELQKKNEILIDNSILSKKYYFGLNKPLFFKYSNKKIANIISVKTPVSNQMLKEVFIQQ